MNIDVCSTLETRTLDAGVHCGGKVCILVMKVDEVKLMLAMQGGV